MKNLGVVETIGDAWISFLKEVTQNGVVRVYDKNEIIKEVCGLSISIKHAKWPDTIIEKYMDKDAFKWMEDNFTKQGLVRELNNAKSYASRLYNYMNKKNQIEWVINKLKKKPSSCSATITTFDPLNDESYIPCISLLDFYIENNVLNLYVYARSLDWGKKAYANLVMLTKILEEVSEGIDVPVGGIELTVKVSRVYKEENDIVERILCDY